MARKWFSTLLRTGTLLLNVEHSFWWVFHSSAGYNVNVFWAPPTGWTPKRCVLILLEASNNPEMYSTGHDQKGNSTIWLAIDSLPKNLIRQSDESATYLLYTDTSVSLLIYWSFLQIKYVIVACEMYERWREVVKMLMVLWKWRRLIVFSAYYRWLLCKMLNRLFSVGPYAIHMDVILITFVTVRQEDLRNLQERVHMHSCHTADNYGVKRFERT